MKTYHFNQQLADGEQGERRLDDYFTQWFTIRHATASEQRRGIEFRRLRHILPHWQQQYPQRAIPNQGYHTHGLLVPLKEFERIAEQVLPI